MRILLQKALQGSLRLPLDPISVSEPGSDGAAAGKTAAAVPLSEVPGKVAALRRAALSTLAAMMGLQQALLLRNTVRGVRRAMRMKGGEGGGEG